ncbi:hypothetical protein AA0474_0261 [Acetobacter lovaniensis NRIC 0474]|nr:hypothetical protein AA0474_0261 [Acetobacter lovaniensis NRIC 0474]
MKKRAGQGAILPAGIAPQVNSEQILLPALADDPHPGQCDAQTQQVLLLRTIQQPFFQRFDKNKITQERYGFQNGMCGPVEYGGNNDNAPKPQSAGEPPMQEASVMFFKSAV